MALEFGRYQLLKKIASGGMGQVFLARAAGERGFEKLLVIKRILPHLTEDDDFLTMFFDEARIAARLNHPNVVQIFDLGEAAGSHYLAMEYLAGEDVRRMEKFARAQGAKIPLGAICRIVADAAAGLDYAHKARDSVGKPLGIVHRDVSPQNVLVGFDGAVKLIDFGVAKAAGKAQHTATGFLKGKYAYMSPEQADGEEIDHRSDVFALGIVFWELLADRRLFKGENDVMTMRLVKECQVPPPSKLAPNVPAALDAIVLKALAKNRDDRYVDAAAMRLAIEDFAVAQHLPASSAHLVAFMQQLYAERIAQENDTSSLDMLPPNVDVDPYSNASMVPKEKTPTSGPGAAMKGTARTVGGLPPPQKATPATAVAPPPPQRSRGTILVVGALAFMLLGAGVGLVVKLSRSSTSKAIDPIAVAHDDPPPRHDDPPPRHDDPKPEPVPVRLVSDPLGARVEIAGKDLGVTPIDYALEANAGPVLAVFTKDGFEPAQASVSTHDAPQFSVQLKKKHALGKRQPGIKTER